MGNTFLCLEMNKTLAQWLKSRDPFDEQTMSDLAGKEEECDIDAFLGYPAKVTSKKKFLAIMWLLKYYPDLSWRDANDAICSCYGKKEYLPLVVEAVSARFGVAMKDHPFCNTSAFLLSMLKHAGSISIEHALSAAVSHDDAKVQKQAREYLSDLGIDIPEELPDIPMHEFPDVDF